MEHTGSLDAPHGQSHGPRHVDLSPVGAHEQRRAGMRAKNSWASHVNPHPGCARGVSRRASRPRRAPPDRPSRASSATGPRPDARGARAVASRRVTLRGHDAGRRSVSRPAPARRRRTNVPAAGPAASAGPARERNASRARSVAVGPHESGPLFAIVDDRPRSGSPLSGRGANAVLHGPARRRPRPVPASIIFCRAPVTLRFCIASGLIHGDGASSLVSNDLLPAPDGLNGLREPLIGLAQSELHVVTILH